MKKIDGKIYVFLIFRIKRTKRLLLEGIRTSEPVRKAQTSGTACPKCGAINVQMRNINAKNMGRLIKEQFNLE